MIPLSKNPPSLWPEKSSISEIQGEWKVAHLKPRQEKALAQDLIRAGISYCCPFYLHTVRRKDNNKLRKSMLPVFSSYVAFADTGGLSPRLMKTDRIMRILPVIDQKRLLQELDWILKALSQGKSLLPLSAEMKKGQYVRIAAGPMKGFEGEIVQIGGQNHIILSVEMFHQSVAIQVDANVLKPIEKKEE